MNGFGPKAIVRVAMCVLAVVVLACLVSRDRAHPTPSLGIQGTDVHSVAGNRPDPEANCFREVSSVAFSPDGKGIAAGMIFSGWQAPETQPETQPYFGTRFRTPDSHAFWRNRASSCESGEVLAGGRRNSSVS
jgi:hypothetical protein